jgi:hypothetical protein
MEARGYCNMTYIAEDIADKSITAWFYTVEAATAAAIKTKETVTFLAGKADVHGRRLAQDISIHSKWAYQKSNQIYNEQYQKQWPKIKPHYDQHVAPLVDKAKVWKAKNVDPKLNSAMAEYNKIKSKDIDPRLEALHKQRKVAFVKLVETYATTCKESHRFLVDFAKTNDLQEQLSSVATAMKESCQRPEHSVTLALKMLLVLFLLPFVGRIFGLAWSIARLALNIFLTVTLIRFFLPRGKSSVKATKPQPVKAHGTPNKAHGGKKKRPAHAQ